MTSDRCDGIDTSTLLERQMASYQDAICVLEREIENRDHPEKDALLLARRILLSEGDGP